MLFPAELELIAWLDVVVGFEVDNLCRAELTSACCKREWGWCLGVGDRYEGLDWVAGSGVVGVEPTKGEDGLTTAKCPEWGGEGGGKCGSPSGDEGDLGSLVGERGWSGMKRFGTGLEVPSPLLLAPFSERLSGAGDIFVWVMTDGVERR